MSRAEVTVIAAMIKGRYCIHFTDTKLQGDDLWFPVFARAGPRFFRSIEWIMQAHNVAHNVTHVELVRRGLDHVDYRVTYNLPE